MQLPPSMTPRLPPAILFDLDDTILASGHRPAVLLHVAHEYAAHLGGLSPVDLADRLEAAFAEFWSDPERHKVGRFDLPTARLGVIADVFARSGAPQLSADLAQAFADRFNACREELMDFFPGALQAVVALKAQGVRLALVTNGSAEVQRAKVERFSLAPLFDHIQIEGEHGFGKPEDRAYLHAMAALGVTPDQTWMVGDHLEWEVAAPQRLGIYAIWHDHLGQGLPPGSAIVPDRIIRSLSELLT
ncbi:MAG TPA: HAD family hydrolase [Phenylobacterium sp.]|nr:HAD family hydrolase [Phenylobacterium sp.]